MSRTGTKLHQALILSTVICSMFVSLILANPNIAAAATVITTGVNSCVRTNSCTIDNLSKKCTDTGECSNDEAQILSWLKNKCGDGTISCSTTDKQTLDDTTAAKTKYDEMPTSCSGIMDSIRAPFTCGLRWFIATVSAALIYLAAWLLAFAGLIFNLLMDYTVLHFGSTYAWMQQPIEKAWTVFRDISNILIIGIFVFIAISIILGLTEYGQKKLIANVLIIAVLINFSLLFTKLIVDASNFTAVQFYGAMKIQDESNTSTGTSLDPLTSASKSKNIGIAGTFLKLMGVTSFADTISALEKAGENGGGVLPQILQGLASATLILGAACVLLYGAFLLTSRAILIIFLLLTSSVAFATYLTPNDSMFQKQGWHKWWQALISSSILAPILLIFLWATLAVAQGIQVGLKSLQPGGSLGGFIEHPTNAGNLTAILGYVIVLGLLFLSFKVSSSFATKIGGFNFASAALTMATGGTFAVASRFAGAGLRQTVGAGAANRANNLKETAATRHLQLRALVHDGLSTDSAEYKNKLAEISKLKSRAASATNLASRDFNFMNTGTGKNIAKRAGLSGVFTGEKKVGGYIGSGKAQVEQAAKAGGETVISKDEAEEIARKEIGAETAVRKEGLRVEHDAAQDLVKTTKDAIEDIKRTESLGSKHEVAKTDVTNAQSQKDRVDSEYGKQIKEIADKIAAETTDPARSGLLRNQMEARRMQRETALKEQDDHIQKAQAEVQRIQTRIAEIEKPFNDARQALTAKKQELDTFNTNVKKLVQNRTQEVINKSQDIAADTAHFMAYKSTGDEYFAKQARNKTKGGFRMKRVKERLMAEKELSKEAGEDEEGEEKKDH